MATGTLARFFLLPELELVRSFPIGRKGGIGLEVRNSRDFAVCSRCANKTKSVHDKRRCRVRDEPARGRSVSLYVTKRRFRCRPCRKVFTEHIPGIQKWKKTTERFRRAVLDAAEKYTSLKRVQEDFRCSSDTVYQCTYEQLELRQKARTYPLPEVIGLDEHSLKKPKYQATHYSTVIVDHKNHRLFDLIDGRSLEELKAGFSSIEGHGNVKWVTIDFSPTFRSFTRSQFPNAEIVVDRFHAQRLFTKKVNRYRKNATGDKRKNPIRKLLLRNNKDLEKHERKAVTLWLKDHPDVKEIYDMKEQMRRVYTAKNIHIAGITLTNLCDRMGMSKFDNIRALRKVIVNWRKEILNYHRKKISHGRTEGFNRKAKLCQRAAYGFRKFSNYRLKLLNLCR